MAAAAPGDLGGAAAAMRVFCFRKLGFRVSGISFSPFFFCWDFIKSGDSGAGTYFFFKKKIEAG
jgi:hypothetical protein